MRRLALSLVLLAGAGCADRRAGGPAGPSAASTAPIADPPAEPGDLVVATVDGLPVWASCVRGHVRARGVSVDQALTDCVDLELLAQAAARRGAAADPEVATQRRVALVDALLAREAEGPLASPAGLTPEVRAQALAKARHLLDEPERRLCVYVRATVPDDAPAGGPADQAARALAEAIYAELGPQQGVLPDELFAAAERLAAGRPLDLGRQPYATQRHGQSDEAFAAALFDIADRGQVSRPARTRWGWDVIFLIDVRPARQRSEDEVLAEVFPALRQSLVDDWALARRRAARPQVWPERLAAFEGEPDDGRAPARTGPGAPRP
jgi:hypothetical protein